METSKPDLSPRKLNRGSKKVRIVGKIRGFTDQELGFQEHSKHWISVSKPRADDAFGKARVVFGEKGTSRKDTFELDYCYEQGEDEGLLFSREIKPAISDVLTGKDASIIAFGARGSGKTHTIQGLATLAIGDILSRVEDSGKRVSISFFEVFQERVYDLLDPDQHEVHVFEDSQGKVKLKGLSQVSIKSVTEFHDIYHGQGQLCKQVNKTSVRRSHKGLIVNVSSPEINKLTGVINFVDLAGYEDSRSSIRDGATLAESTRINKPLHSIMNVVFALNTNDSHVPYRETKLTRMLKESLGGNNYTLMLACMNPVFCQDTIYTVSLASRSCENIKTVFRNPTKKCASSTKRDIRPPTTTPSSVKKQTSSVVHDFSAKKTTSVKKQTSSVVHDFSAKKTTSVKKQTSGGVHDFSAKKSSSVLKGRKLFTGGTVKTSKQDDSLATKSKLLKDTASIITSSLQEEAEVPQKDSGVVMSELLQDDTVYAITSSLHKEAELPSEPSQADTSSLAKSSLSEEDVPQEMEITSGISGEIIGSNIGEGGEIEKENKVNTIKECEPEKESKVNTNEDGDIEKENKVVNTDNDGSPLLSERLRALTNHLKELQASTPLAIRFPEEGSQACLLDSVEPKTPVVENDSLVGDRLDITKYNSPWEAFSERNSKAKKSIVEEYLRFLNSANKEELKRLKGIGEKRATYILELREDSPEPFKKLEDLQEIGLSAKQVKSMMKKNAEELFMD